MNKPTPKEFAAKFLTLMFPAILAFIVFLMFVGCGTTEEMYKSSNSSNYTIYKNKHGDLIEVPWDKTECEGYKKGYHKTEFNVGSNKR